MESKQWNPGQMLEISGFYWKTCTLHAGVKLDIFTIIGRRQLSAEEVAAACGGDERGVTMLLNALVAMELLTQTEDEQYANTPAAEALLSKQSARYIGYMIMHHHYLVESWARLDQAVLTGKPVRVSASSGTAAQRESFLMGMFNLAMSIAPDLTRQTDLSERRHLLDLGGGPGTYAIHFCMNNPRLRATVYDLPTTRPFAEKTIARFEMSDRVGFTEGNYLEDGIDGEYDVAWLSHILHGEGPDDCRRIIRKAVDAMSPGGIIMIHDFILNDYKDGPLFPALFSLNMLLGTPGGQAYSEQEIVGMLAEAGISQIRRMAFRGPNDSGIMMGIKQTD